MSMSEDVAPANTLVSLAEMIVKLDSHVHEAVLKQWEGTFNLPDARALLRAKDSWLLL